MKQNNTFLNICYALIIYCFFYSPIVILIVYSFNNAEYSLLWHGFTYQWYLQLFHDHALWTAALHSLMIGILAASIASIIGLLASVCLYRYRFMGRSLLNGLIFVLIIMPDIVLGTGLLLLFSLTKITFGFWTLLLAHITFCIPFVTITTYSTVITFDKNIFEAAKDLGANDITIFFRIIVPLLLPAIIAGWLLSFTLSIDDVIISYFVAGPSFQILPLAIFSMVKLGINPELNALCSILFIFTLLLVTMSQFSMSKEKKRSKTYF